EVEVQRGSFRTQGDAAERRKTISLVEARKFRRLACRPPGAAHSRRQKEAAFIKENQVCPAYGRLLDDARKLVSAPTSDRSFIAFASPLARLLRRPVQDFVQESSDVIVMERHVEL